MTTIFEKDSTQSAINDSENNFKGFSTEFYCHKCSVSFQDNYVLKNHCLRHLASEESIIILQRLDPKIINNYSQQRKKLSRVQKSSEDSKLKLKIHRVVGTNGHEIYQVSAKETDLRLNMEEPDIEKSEEGDLKLGLEKEPEAAVDNSTMDKSQKNLEPSDSPQKSDHSEREPGNATPISNGKESQDPSSNITRATTDDEEENNTGDSGVSSPGDSKKDVIIKSPLAKEVKLEPTEAPKSPTDSDISDAPAENVQQQPSLIRLRNLDDLCEKGESDFGRYKLIQQPKQEGGDELYMCSVCPERFPSGTALEAHMARTGHYSVSAHPEPSQAAQGPMQQLAQQVQRIPASFNSQPYRPDQPVPPSQIYNQNAYPPPPPQRINMLGPQVKLTPVTPSNPPQSSSLPNLPPGIQLQKRPAQQNLENSQPKQRREEVPTASPTVKLPSSITLVRPSQPAPPKKPDNNVADILANRGITMTTSGAKSGAAVSVNSRVVPIASGGVSQLNSSVSITPSARSQQPAYSGRPLPTVDLTSDPDTGSHHPMAQPTHHVQQQQQQQSQIQRVRNRQPPGLAPPHARPPARVSCQVCDKVFNSQEALNQHLPSHRGIHNKLPFECKECTAQYPTAQGLAVHKQKYHKTASTILDMAIPVVDLKQNGVLHKLTSLGVRNFIPLAQLHNQQNTGQFCLPIVSVELANNPAFCNISGIGASNLLPLGPLKNIPM